MTLEQENPADTPGLLAAGRQAVILEQVTRDGAVRVRELAQRLGVSDMTIRRDIDALAESGAVEKVHGGATLPTTLSREEPGFAAKQLLQGAQKRAIAGAARSLVHPGMVIGLSAGTTTYAIASELRRVPDLTVITNSMQIAKRFQRGETTGLTVLLTGGERTPSDALVGPIGVAALQTLHVDLLLLGVHGMAERAGFTTPNLLESELDRAFIAAATRLAVVTDASKWGVIGMSRIAPLDAADVLVTDDAIDPEARAVLESRIPTVLVATAHESSRRRAGSGSEEDE